MSDPILNQAATDSLPSSDQVVKGGEWVDQLTPDLKDEAFFKEYKEKGLKISDFAKKALEAHKVSEEVQKKLQGAILPLGDNPTPEQVKAYQKALGVPDSEDGYDFKGIDMPMRDEAIEKQMKVIMKNAGIPASAAKDFYKGYADLAKTMAGDIAKKNAEKMANAEAELQKEWGKDFNTKSSAVNAALEKALSPEALTAARNSGLLAEPSFRKLVASAGKAYLESGFVSGRSQAPTKGGYSDSFYQQADAARK